jgi:hypothetical protein
MSKIILKKSSVVDKIPLPADLAYGELALNYADSKLFFKKPDNTIGTFSAGSALQNRYSYNATAAQTTFSASYTPPYVDVYLNGLRLSSGVDYTATSGSSIVLTPGASVNDLVEIVAQVVSTTVLVDDTKLALAGGTMTGVIGFAAGQTFPGTQTALVSGTSIKTINGTSVLGSGNIEIDVGVTSFNTRTGAVTLSSSDVTTALGFTPVTQTAVDSSISALVDSSPATLNTLNELAAALGDDPNFATTVTSNIASKLSLSGGTLTGASTVSVASWAKWTLETTGTTAKARQGSDANGLNFTSNALWNGSWTEDDSTKKKFAYIQHLGNGRHEFRTAASGAGISWVTGLTVDEAAVNSLVALQQGGNQVLHAGNYNSYALPLSGGSLTGSLTLTANSTSIRQNSTASWSGDAPNGVGKLEYHSNRWYINAGADSTEIANFRRGATSVATISNTGVYSGSIAGNAATATTLQTARTINGTSFNGSVNIDTTEWVHSDRDFPNGTLITTNINYAVSSGDPFVLEIRGNTYGNVVPLDLLYQGYIYADTIINHGGVSNGLNISGLVAINNGGNLCFWFPSQGYWNGYNVKVYTALATRATNRVTSITGVAKPTTAKEVALSANIRQSLHSGNYTSYAPSLTGSGASGTWGISVTGASARISVPDTRAVNDQPQNKTGYAITADFKENSAVNNPPVTSSGLYSHVITVAGWDTAGGSGGWPSQLSIGDGIAVRQATNATTWGAWRNVLHSNNYGNYSTFNQVVVASQAGFQSATYSAGRNRIWSFANADAYGISYFQGGTDTIGFHFGTASLAGSVGRVTATGLASFATLGLNNGFEIQQGGSNYGQFNTWVHLNGSYGFYAATNGAHFYPNNGSYGSWRIDGSRNGWAGIEFGTGTSLMMNDDSYGFHRNTSGQWKFYVSGGNGYFPGNVTAYWSDARLKENLREIKHESLDILSTFTAYRFNWNSKVAEIGDTIPVGKEEIGLIAQQVQATLPDAVVVNKAGAKVGDSDFDYLTINYDRITPLLVEGVNIHTQEISELRSQVSELKNLVQQLMKAQ